MPKAFMNCVKGGGRVFTKSLPKGKYVHGCEDKKGNVFWGEVKKSKGDQKSKKSK